MTGPQTILVVEDDLRLLRLVRLTLENDGFKVSTAQDGETALKMIADHQPDLIVLDIVLPGETDGYAVCRTVRTFSQVPIIMLTSRMRESDKLTGFECGADDYVSKPFSCPELKARIKAVLHRASLASEQQGSSKFTVGDLEVDFLRRRVHLDGKEVPLTQTEYQVLQCLARNAGKVLLHGEILAAVWGAEYRDEYQYLRNYISNLRRKIEPDPANPRYILSKPGIGYLMSDE